MKSDLIVFGEDWGSHPSSTQHLIKHISAERRTLWVNSIGLRRPRLSLKDLRRLYAKGKSLVSKNTDIEDKNVIQGPLDIVPPKIVPWPGNNMARQINRVLFKKQLQEKIHAHKLQKPIFWTSLPTAVDVLDQFDQQAVVYYCGDDFGALDGVDHTAVLACEERLCKQADLILAASPRLMDKLPTDKTVLLPHGVDHSLFSTPTPCPQECRVSTPIAGFYGSIAEWIDVELIATTAQAMPDWIFMFIGPIKTDVSMLHKLDNVKFLPAVAHHELPKYVQHWQAALLPFKNNDQIEACNPLKLREYLASGTPVISTDFPALAPYRDFINVVNSPAQLVKTLEHVRPIPGQSQLVEEESWQHRAQQVDDLLMRWDIT